MPHSFLFLETPKPYWSKQHGAYLTLITCWLIAVLLSRHFFENIFFQVSVLVLLLSGLNLGELLIEKLNRKSPLPRQKRGWLIIYSFLTLGSAVIVFAANPTWRFLLPLLTAGGTIFILLSLKRKQKSVVAEWITFALFSLAGLLAYKPSVPLNLEVIANLAFLMAVYFGLSIFTVKARLGKIPAYAALIYAVAAAILLIIYYGLTSLAISICLLLLLKALPVAVLSEWYGRLKIKYVGMMEMGFHLVFVFILFMLYS
jgi:hypothetical protein